MENFRRAMLKSNYVVDHGRWWIGMEWIGAKPRWPYDMDGLPILEYRAVGPRDGKGGFNSNKRAPESSDLLVRDQPPTKAYQPITIIIKRIIIINTISRNTPAVTYVHWVREGRKEGTRSKMRVPRSPTQ